MDASHGQGIRRRSGWPLPILVLLLVSATVAACSTPLVPPGRSPRPTPSPSPTFELDLTGIDGRVVDENGEPLADVRLVLRLGGRRGTAATTAEGTFFDRGNLGEIGITASLEGYQTEETTVVVVPDEVTEIEIVLAPHD